jgi:Ser/Thr protein kinase RdoA (MazF antagonist)
MKRLAAEVQREIQRESSAWADVGLIHADLHAENVHFHSDGSLALFDFDLLGTGWRAYDLAVFFWSRHLLARDTGHADQGWQAFLQGYLTHRSLPDADRQAVPLLAAARQIWIMGLHTGPPTRHYGRRWLDKRYLQKHLTLLGSLASRVPQLEHFASEPQH